MNEEFENGVKEELEDAVQESEIVPEEIISGQADAAAGAEEEPVWGTEKEETVTAEEVPSEESENDEIPAEEETETTEPEADEQIPPKPEAAEGVPPFYAAPGQNGGYYQNPGFNSNGYYNPNGYPGGYGQPPYGNPGFNPGYNQNPGGFNSQYRAPVQPAESGSAASPGKKKGMKVFLSAVAVILVFALCAGMISIIKYKNKNKAAASSSQTQYEANGGNADKGGSLDIHASPVSPTDTNVSGPLSTTQIAAKVRASNVGIMVYANNSTSAAGEGSGVIMKEDGSGNTYIITCAHVINDAGVSVKVQTEDGTSYDAEIVGFDTRTDLGVIRIQARGLTAAEFGDSNALTVGDPVYAVGNPGGVEFFGSFTGGYVASIDRPISSEIGYTMKCIQHSAAINPGNSGGALANQYGQIVGINSQKITATDFEGIGFAIPISSAKEIIENLIQFGYVPNRPMLGITYYSISSSAQYSMIAQIKGLPAGSLIINEINPESSLANTDVRQYDLITKVNGKPLSTADVLLELIDNGKVGDKFKLTICRINSNYQIDEFEVEATLVEDKNGSEPVSTTAYQYNPFDFFGDFGF